MKKFIICLFVVSFVFQAESFAAEKRFKRALIVGGLGIAPGVALGVIAGLKKAGMEPDLIITTCGASISSGIYNNFNDDEAALNFTKSVEFKNIISQARVNTKNVLKVRKQFKEAEDLYLMPPIFNQTILRAPPEFDKFLPENTITGSGTTKVIILAAKANFGPELVGWPRGKGKSFNQVYFTDAETGTLLKDFKSPISQIFPKSFVDEKTFVITDATPEQAVRASIADPFLINPAVINGEYYFTGAVNLLPVELAHELADEVISNYPASLYTDFEDLAIKSTFGFDQTDSVRHSIKDPNVKWIDLYGVEAVKMDPKRKFLKLKNGIPEGPITFANKVQAQWDFGYKRAIEAMKAQVDGPSRKHLRNRLESL